MKNLNPKTLLCLLGSMLAWAACTDHEGVSPAHEGQLVALSEHTLMVTPKAQYKTLCATPTRAGLAMRVEADAPWIELLSDTVAADGYFQFLVRADELGTERRATVTVTATDGLHTDVQRCEVVQGADDGSNSDEPAAKTMRVGYGYDIYGAFQNDVSVMAAIIDQSILSRLQDQEGLVATMPRSVLTTEHITARSLTEMASILTEKEEKTKSGVTKGSSKTVNVHATYSQDDEQYAYIRLLKTVAMRSIDMGVLRMLLDRGEELFTSRFTIMRARLIAAPPSVRTQRIDELLDWFGTHLVVEAELGATIELSLNFRRDMSGSLATRTEDFADYFFKNETSSFLLTGNKIKDLTNNVSVRDKTCVITGGSLATRQALTNAVDAGRPHQKELEAWLDSSSGDITSDATIQALAPVNFRLIPIWFLFPTDCVGDIIRRINERGERSSSAVAGSQVGADYYRIDIQEDLLRFGDGSEDTQVKVLYASHASSGEMTPVLEICNEYVPAIRGDKRIPVIYGLRGGSPFHGAGLFPGDGAGNPPAWLTFSEGQVYVMPVEGKGPNDVCDILYYMNGNTYTESFGVNVDPPKRMHCEDAYMELKFKYPIVKIGSGYWTRKFIIESLEFGAISKLGWQYFGPLETAETFFVWEIHGASSILYASFNLTNTPEFLAKYNNMYGNDVNAFYNKRTKWFMPSTEDVNNLTRYIGNETRLLFKNQISGFEAQFVPYCDMNLRLDGIIMISDNEVLKLQPFKYDDLCCYFSCIDNNNSPVLMYIPDGLYDMHRSELPTNVVFFYPIRLYRTAYWKYPSINP